MTEEQEMWLPIAYAEFYDIPRAFQVNFHDKSFFFDCQFSKSLDDYPDKFVVYQLLQTLALGSAATHWKELHTQGDFIGSIGVRDVVFDDSKRNAINRKSVEAFIGIRNKD